MKDKPTSLRLKVPVVLLALLLFAVSIPAEASPFRHFGYDTSAMAGANSDIAYGDSYGVLYSNPALMSRFAPQTGIMFTVIKPSLKIELQDRPAGADVPLMYYDSNVARYQHIQDRGLATSELVNKRGDTTIDSLQAYMGAGVTYSFGIEGFRVGSLFVVPLLDVINSQTHYSDEREQYYSNKVHFERFGEWQKIIGGIVGASYSPVKQISLGVGMQVSASLVADMTIFIPEATVQDYGLMNISDMRMAVKFRPIVGVQSEPLEWLSLGLTWRAESYIRTDAVGGLNLWNYHQTFEDPADKRTIPKNVAQKYTLIMDYEPMELAGALGFRYAGWQIQGSVTWNRWRNYIDQHGNTPESAAVTPPVNPGDVLVSGDEYGWMDTLSTNIGTSYRYADWGQVKMGFAFEPSPVPAQRGRTSYADSDTWCLSLGHRFDFELAENRFNVELGVQFWQMVERTVNKDPNQIRDEFPDHSRTSLDNQLITSARGLQTNNPGFPGYTQKGWLLVTSAMLNYQF